MTLEEQLIRDEGQRLEVYYDTEGIRTAGVGHNLQAHKIWSPIGTVIPKELSDNWLAKDIEDTKREVAEALPWTQSLDDARLGVVLNMWFNMGERLLTFHHMLLALSQGDFNAAADEMGWSAWVREVGPRAKRLEQQMRTGEWV